MSRRYFGTDGVRGIVGAELTPELVERVGRAATLWAGGGRVLVGRDTRASGPELESAVADGIVSAGGTAVLGGVLPTPAVALLADGLGIVVSASHNPPEYNGVKLFRSGGKLVDHDEEEIEALFESPAPGGGSTELLEDAAETYLAHVVRRFGSDLTGLRIGVDCANGAFSSLAPRAFRELGADVHPIGIEPDGSNINVGCGATDLEALQYLVTRRGLDLGVIAVTVMTNLGFHRLMAEHRVKVVTTPVGDRYVLEALERDGGLLGGEQSGHLIWLGNHVTGDGLAAALLLCGAVRGRSLSEATAVMSRYPQVKRNIRVSRTDVPQAVLDEVDRLNGELGEQGRVLVRRSGTEPVMRILAEAENAEDAEKLCASIAALVERELG